MQCGTVYSMATKKTHKVYEVSFHLLPTIGEQSGKKSEEIKGNITAKGGEVLESVAPEQMDLAYTIRHSVRKQDGSYSRYDEAYFGSVKFKASQKSVKDIRQDLQADNDILRFLIVETVEGNTRIGPTLPGVEDEPKEQDTDSRRRPRGGRRAAEGSSSEGEGSDTKETKNATMEA